jgi:hypothetical protein
MINAAVVHAEHNRGCLITFATKRLNLSDA